MNRRKNGTKNVKDFIGWQSQFAEMYSISPCPTRLIFLWDWKCCIYFPAAVVALTVDAGLVVLLHRYYFSWLIYSLQIGQNIRWLTELVIPFKRAAANYHFATAITIWTSTCCHIELRFMMLNIESLYKSLKIVMKYFVACLFLLHEFDMRCSAGSYRFSWWMDCVWSKDFIRRFQLIYCLVSIVLELKRACLFIVCAWHVDVVFDLH